MPLYSIEERAHCVCWYDATRSAATVQRRFRGRFSRHAAIPGHKAIKKWHKKFFTTGTILRDKRTGRRTVREGEIAATVRQAFQNDFRAINFHLWRFCFCCIEAYRMYFS